MTASVKQAATTWRPHRTAGVVLALLALYAFFGFLLAPWLADRIATGKVREVLGAELRLGDVAINPFTFTVDVEDLEFDHPSGERVARVGGVHINFEPTALFRKKLLSSEILVEGVEVFLQRDARGDLNVASIRPLHTSQEEAGADEPEAGWPLLVETLSVDDMSVSLVDETVAPAAKLGVTNIELDVDDFSTAPDSSFALAVAMELATGGTVVANGQAVLSPQPRVELAIELRYVSPELLHPYIKPLADLTFASGGLNFDGDVVSDPDDRLALTGDAEIVDLSVTETDTGTRLGSWNRLALSQVDLSLANGSLGISEIIADTAYADILISEDGSINLKRVGKDTAAGDEETDHADATEPTAEPGAPFDITIGRVIVNNASATFEDRALPLPFFAKIDGLNGQLSTIATASTKPADVAFEGRVDEYGQVTVSGHVTPLDPRRNTSLDVEFLNVEMPKFSAYAIRFAGHEIASGKVDLQLGYTVTDSKLVGENNIVLRDFELGAAVPHPDAVDLPLRLAVALLKDPSGKIDVSLPVGGDLESPEFRIGSVVTKAFGNLVSGIVASPFKFLGSLLGIEADELEALYFRPGRADLSPPQQEIAARLAEALTMRPQLVLEIPGAYDAEVDGLALRQQEVDARIEAEVGKDDSVPYAERRVAVIESLFMARFGEAPAAGEEGGDPLARAAAMRDRLVAAEPLASDALEALGKARAAKARAAVLAASESLEGRVVQAATETVRSRDTGNIKLKVRLSTPD